MDELERALENWANIGTNDWTQLMETVELLYPFVEFYLKVKADPKRGLYADEMAMLVKLKQQLGVPLMEHEKSLL